MMVSNGKAIGVIKIGLFSILLSVASIAGAQAPQELEKGERVAVLQVENMT